jgi:hypothetical protein
MNDRRRFTSLDEMISLPAPRHEPPKHPNSLPPAFRLRFALLQSLENLVCIGVASAALFLGLCNFYEWFGASAVFTGIASLGDVLATRVRGLNTVRSLGGLLAFWSSTRGL